jgi:O-antigen/teichoic acid export membrane protein
MTVDVRADAHPVRSQVAQNVLMLAGSQAVTWALAVLWTLVVPRAIGARGIGQLTTAYSVTGVLTGLAGFGVTTLLVKGIARDRERGSLLLGTSLVLQAGAVLPVLALIAVYAGFGHFDRTELVVLWLVTAGSVLAMFGSRLEGSLQGIQRMDYVAYGRILSRTSVSAVAIALVGLGFGVIALAILGAAVTAVVTAVQAFWVLREFRLQWRVSLRQLGRLVAEAAPYGAGEVVAVIYLWVDAMLLALLAPSYVVGWYGAPTRLLGALLFVPVILSTAWLPRLAEQFKYDPRSYRQNGRAAIELTLILGLPIAAGTLMVASRVVGLFYGPGFGGAVPVLALLGASVPFIYSNVIAWAVLAAGDRQLAWTKVMAAATVLNILLNLALIPYFQSRQGNGAIGSATALLITEVLMSAAAVLLVRDLLDRSTVKRVLRALTATAAMAAVVWLTAVLGLAIQIGLGAVTFLAVALVLRVFTTSELRQVAADALKARGVAP